MNVNLSSPKLYPYLLHERDAAYSTPVRRIKFKTHYHRDHHQLWLSTPPQFLANSQLYVFFCLSVKDSWVMSNSCLGSWFIGPMLIFQHHWKWSWQKTWAGAIAVEAEERTRAPSIVQYCRVRKPRATGTAMMGPESIHFHLQLQDEYQQRYLTRSNQKHDQLMQRAIALLGTWSHWLEVPSNAIARYHWHWHWRKTRAISNQSIIIMILIN